MDTLEFVRLRKDGKLYTGRQSLNKVGGRLFAEWRESDMDQRQLAATESLRQMRLKIEEFYQRVEPLRRKNRITAVPEREHFRDYTVSEVDQIDPGGKHGLLSLFTEICGWADDPGISKFQRQLDSYRRRDQAEKRLQWILNNKHVRLLVHHPKCQPLIRELSATDIEWTYILNFEASTAFARDDCELPSGRLNYRMPADFGALWIPKDDLDPELVHIERQCSRSRPAAKELKPLWNQEAKKYCSGFHQPTRRQVARHIAKSDLGHGFSEKAIGNTIKWPR